MTREYLINLCEKAIVDVRKWRNRDSPSSQEKVGILWAMLKAGCDFEILYDKDGLCTGEYTIWIKVWWPRFIHFDWDGFDLNNRETLEYDTFYLPTESRLYFADSGDWY